MICIKCESDNIFESSEAETVFYNKSTLSVDMDYTVCRDCGYEYITTEQILSNELRINKQQSKVKRDG